MERYRSAGVATIAALMAADRPGEGAPRPEPVRPRGAAARAVALSAVPEAACASAPDLSRIGRRCERAVVTAYRDLLMHGTDVAAALRAATTLYRIHHPDAAAGAAQRLVAAWIDHHLRGGDAGATPGCACD